MKIWQGLFLCIVLWLSACSFNQPMDEVKQWRLMPIRQGSSQNLSSKVWLTQGNIAVVSPFDSKSWVFRVDDARYRKDFYNEYISSPGEMIATATKDWMEQAGIFAFVTNNSNSLFTNYVLQGSVEELSVDIRHKPQVSIRIEYLLTTNLNNQNPVLLRKVYSASENIEQKAGGKEIISAQERAFSQILSQLEADLSVISKNLSKSPNPSRGSGR